MYVKFQKLAAAAALAITFGAAPALADTVSYVSAGVNVGQTAQISKTSSPTVDGTFNVGQILLTGVTTLPDGGISGIPSGTSSLLAWCIDLLGTLDQTNGTFNAGAINTAAGKTINAIITGGDGADNILTSQEAAATQVAIWKVMYGRNNISSTTGSLNSLANTYYDAATANSNNGSGLFVADTSKYLLALLENPDTRDQQQLVTLLTSTPEPASLALLSVGLIALGTTRRKLRRS